MKLKLSEMFEVKIPLCEFEWTDTMLNINSDCNRELLERCKDLQDYLTYVKIVEENKKSHANMREAVTAALMKQRHRCRILNLEGYFLNYARHLAFFINLF